MNKRLSVKTMVAVLLLCGVSAAAQARSGEEGQDGSFSLRVLPDTVYPGEVVRIFLDGAGLRDTAAAATSGVVGELKVSGREFPVIMEGAQRVAYVGFDLDTEPGKTSVAFRVGRIHGSREVVVERKTFGSESLKVKSGFTDLDKATVVRVQSESKRLHKLWKTVTPRKLWSETFVKPTDGAFGSPFGLRRIFNGKPRSPHSGLDIKSPLGTPIHASNEGRVVEASHLFFTGNTVVIDHGLGLYTLYAHMSRIDVKAGQEVDRGQVIGLVGATGRVTGPHLHWGAKLVGSRVDPVSLLGL